MSKADSCPMLIKCSSSLIKVTPLQRLLTRSIKHSDLGTIFMTSQCQHLFPCAYTGIEPLSEFHSQTYPGNETYQSGTHWVRKCTCVPSIVIVCPSVHYGRSAELIWPQDVRDHISGHWALIETRARQSLWMAVEALAIDTNTSFLDGLYKLETGNNVHLHVVACS